MKPDSLGQWFPIRASVPLRDIRQRLQMVWRVATLGGGDDTTGFLWVEARDAATYHTVHRTAPTTKKDPTPKVNGGKGEKRWTRRLMIT